jgi:general secretion pathway protein L
MTILIVTLSQALPSAATLCQGVLSDDGRTVSRAVEAPALLLPAPSGVEIVAVVPASRLSWHRLSLPRGALKGGLFQEGSAARLRAVLDGLLEDRVLDETSNLHFAIEPRPRADEPVWIAACDRAWLHAWLATLAQAGRPAGRIVPELAPPSGAATGNASLHVTGTPEHAQLMLAGEDGVTLLPLSAPTAALIAWPEGVEVLAEPGVAALAENLFNRPATLQTAAERWLAAAQPGWDLAQFDLLYNRSTRTRKQLSAMLSSLFRAPRWRPARWAAVALFAINLVGLQAWAWKEQSALAAQRSAIRNTLTTTFPEVRVVVDAPVQMARALNDLQHRNGSASPADMEVMLGQLQAAAPDLPTPSAIEFIAGEVRLKGLDSAAAALGAISSRLQALGYSVRLESGSLVMKQERLP